MAPIASAARPKPIAARRNAENTELDLGAAISGLL
jgi:hypothetical protein